jgi:hypothetical protein
MVLRQLIMPAKVSKWEEQNIMKRIISRIAVMNTAAEGIDHLEGFEDVAQYLEYLHVDEHKGL